MAPQLGLRCHRPGPSNTQRARLIYTLFLLENARNALETELLNFTKKVFKIDPTLTVAY